MHPVARAQLAAQALDVMLDGNPAQLQLVGDFLVAETRPQSRQHIMLAACQPWLVGAMRQLCCQRRRDEGFTICNQP